MNMGMVLSPRNILTFLLVGSLCLSDVSARRSRRFPTYASTEADVLQGIEKGEYEEIYIHYHRCVWSEFGNGYGCGDDNVGNGDDAEWYMGRTQCYRANVAYSLYGIRSDDKRKNHPENVCSKRRYFINSFFSTNGVEDFGGTVGLANGDDATSYCTVEANGDDDNNGNRNQQRQHGEIINRDTHSYTTYCDAHGNFVTAQFGGAYCSDKSSLLRLDSLNALNNELDNVGCLLVYEKNGNNGNGANAEDQQEEEAEQEAEDEQEDNQEAEEGNDEGRRLENQQGNAYGGLQNLLAYSTVCSLVEYPKGCPDPFGAKRRFDINASRSNGFWKQFKWIDWLTLIFFLLSIVLLVLAFCVYKDRRRRIKATTNKSQRTGSRWSNDNKNSQRSRSTSRERNRNNNKNDNINKNSSGSKKTNSNSSVSNGNQNGQKSKKGLFRGMFSRKNNGNN